VWRFLAALLLGESVRACFVSQFCSVSALMPSTAANLDCDKPSLPRTFTKSVLGLECQSADDWRSHSHNGYILRLFHGNLASRSPMPQKSVMPAKTNPAPTNADRPKNPRCTNQPSNTPINTSEPERNAAANRRRKPARFAIHESGQDGQAEMLRAEAKSAEAGRSISVCWSWPAY
jgi:hypothetical protein